VDTEEFKLIVRAIESGECLVFLGAGACTPFTDNNGKEIPGLPTGKQLAAILAQRCEPTNGKDLDLARIAEYFLYESSGRRNSLTDILREQIQVCRQPRPIHTVLAQLKPIKIIITTNYDTLLETELRQYGRLLTPSVYRRLDSQAGRFDHSPTLKEGEVILHKMHGTIEEPDSMIITESDYITYLADLANIDRGMPEYFRKTWFPFCTPLFLGYSLEDWNFKVIWEGVLGDYNRRREKKRGYALVKSAEHFRKTYWSSRNIDIFEQDLTEFAARLAGHFNLEIPQLGIDKAPAGGRP